MRSRLTAVATLAALLMTVDGCASSGSHGSVPGYVASIPQLTLDPAAACPRSLGHSQDVGPASDLSGRMVPSADPRGGLVCVYLRPTSTLTAGHAPRLHRQVRLSAADAGLLTRDLPHVKIGSIRATYSCPGGPGRVTVIAFAYAHRSPVDLWYDDSGCQQLDNGHVVAVWAGNPSFYAHFEQHLAVLVR